MPRLRRDAARPRPRLHRDCAHTCCASIGGGTASAAHTAAASHSTVLSANECLHEPPGAKPRRYAQRAALYARRVACRVVGA
jgi:hypothetical protein